MLEYPGIYDVGITKVETAPATASDFGVMASIFYPSDSQNSVHYPKADWDYGPGKFYTAGFGNFVQLPAWFSNTVLCRVLPTVRMAARIEVPVATETQLSCKAPVVILSHGLTGNSTTYSILCGSLASRGFVVLSIEHRDGSASVTAKNNYSESIKYAQPPENADTMRAFRQKQLIQRIHEVKEAYALLCTLNDGSRIANLLSQSLPNFKNRLDLENSILMGHSFGAATTLALLQQPNHPFIAGITFDPWMWPMPLGNQKITVPILSIQAEKFHWKENVDQLKEFWNDQVSNSTSQLSVMINTGHLDISDIPSLPYKRILSMLLKEEFDIPPNAIFGAIDSEMGSFLKTVLFDRNGTLEKIEFPKTPELLTLYGRDAWNVLEGIKKNRCY